MDSGLLKSKAGRAFTLGCLIGMYIAVGGSTVFYFIR